MKVILHQWKESLDKEGDNHICPEGKQNLNNVQEVTYSLQIPLMWGSVVVYVMHVFQMKMKIWDVLSCIISKGFHMWIVLIIAITMLEYAYFKRFMDFSNVLQNNQGIVANVCSSNWEKFRLNLYLKKVFMIQNCVQCHLLYLSKWIT